MLRVPQGRRDVVRKEDLENRPRGILHGDGVPGGIAIRIDAVERGYANAMSDASNNRLSTRVARARRRAAACAVLLVLLPFAAAAADIQVFTVAKGLPSNWVTALAAAPDGKLWVGTGNAGVYLLDPATGRGKGYRASDGLASDEVTSIALFGEKVYVGTASGLSVFYEGKWSATEKIGNVTMRNVRLAASPDGKALWACSVYLAGGTVRFDGKEWEFMGGKGRGLFNDIQGFAFLPGGVAMGSGSGVPYLHTGGDVKALSEGLPPGNIFAVAAEGKILFLGSSRGLFEYDGKWKEVPLPAGFGGASVFAVAARDGEVVIGSDKGLVKARPGKPQALTEGTGLPASRVTAVAYTGALVAAGTARGLALVGKW